MVRDLAAGGGVRGGVLFVCLLFRAEPAAYKSSQAMGRIGAIAASLQLSHSNAGS